MGWRKFGAIPVSMALLALSKDALRDHPSTVVNGPAREYQDSLKCIFEKVNENEAQYVQDDPCAIYYD